MIAVLAVMAIVLTAAAAVTALPDDDQADPPTSSTPPASNPQRCTALETNAEVVSVRGDDESRIAEVTYTLDDDTNDPDIEIAGRLVGEVPPDHSLYMAKSSDPTTQDSTLQQNDGSPYYFLRDELRLGSGGCWQEERWRIGYPCVAGVTVRFHFMIIPRATADDWLDQRDSHPDGFHPQGFEEDPAIVQLGHIDVPTERHPDCPA